MFTEAEHAVWDDYFYRKEKVESKFLCNFPEMALLRRWCFQSVSSSSPDPVMVGSQRIQGARLPSSGSAAR